MFQPFMNSRDHLQQTLTTFGNVFAGELVLAWLDQSQTTIIFFSNCNIRK